MKKSHLLLPILVLLALMFTACQQFPAPAPAQQAPAAAPAEEEAAKEAPAAEEEEAAAPAKDLEKVAVQLVWVKQGEFHGIFNAIENGYYEECGLEVEPLAGGPDVRPMQVVAGGQAQFATGSPSSALHTT